MVDFANKLPPPLILIPRWVRTGTDGRDKLVSAYVDGLAHGGGASLDFGDDHLFAGWQYNGYIEEGRLQDDKAIMVVRDATKLKVMPPKTYGTQDGINAYVCAWNNNRPTRKHFSDAYSSAKNVATNPGLALDYVGAPGLPRPSNELLAANKIARAAKFVPQPSPPASSRTAVLLWQGIPPALATVAFFASLILVELAAASGGPQRALKGAHPSLNKTEAEAIVRLPIAVGLGLLGGSITAGMAYCLRAACCAGLRPHAAERVALRQDPLSAIV